MHIISKRPLRDFWQRWPDAQTPLEAWHQVLTHARPANFAELKALLNSVDMAFGFTIFDIDGNKYRLIADVVYRSQTTFVKHVLTHKEYDKWTASQR